LLQDTHRWAPVLNLQRGYEDTHTSPGKYTIRGGGRRTQRERKAEFRDKLNTTEMEDLPEGDVSIIKTYNLGLVGSFDDIKGLRRTNITVDYNNKSSPVNADHIPPKITFQKAHEMLQKPENQALNQRIKTENPNLYALIDKNGNRGLCREVLTQHHQQALTTGNSKGSHRIREKLTEVLLSGDTHKLMKMSMIAANPEMSASLRRDAGAELRNDLPLLPLTNSFTISDLLSVSNQSAKVWSLCRN
ncbi:hypothetical protein ATANTOWER_028576, partial [Ataeniobius toweri]|nr:hypothetical protein [Ataeniobius toweri]